MQGFFTAGVILGVLGGFGWASVLFAWRRWRGAIASVPAARAAFMGEARKRAVLLLLLVVAVVAAWHR